MQSVASYRRNATALAGYREVNSLRGSLYYLPESIHRVIHLEDTPVPPIFQTRTIRPHRIHITRVKPEKSSRKRSAVNKKSSITIIFGKLSGPKNSAKKFIKSVIRTSAIEPSPDPGPLVAPIQVDGEPVSQSLSVPPGISRPTSERSKPSIRRPFSWTPGSSDTTRMRSSLLARRETKRRSSALAVMGPTVRHGTPTLVGSPLTLAMNSDANLSSAMLDHLPSTGQKIPEEKPIASGNGVSVAIALAEPFLFLQGFEQGDLRANRSTAMLRGSLVLKVTKQTKLKAVTLKFKGTATTKWPEGIPPKKVDFEETSTIMSHTWPFFNAQFSTAENSTGADHVELPKTAENANKRASLDMRDMLRLNSSNANLSKSDRRLSLQVTPIGTTPPTTSVAQKGYRVFQPGDYVYNFELPLDSHLPETLSVELGSVKYELEATVERSGAFRGNLVGTKEISLIRTPAEGSLEQVEPIAIARNWDDQLHYDIVISGKSFPLGGQIPIAFKLTPLAKVQCHRIKVYVTESVEYFCSNRRVHRTEPARRMLLFEKRADNAPISTYPGSSMRVVSGGGIPYEMRAAAARGEPVPMDPNNILGNLEQSNGTIGPTELEINVQLPTCSNMSKDKAARLHFDTTYHNIQVHHWIKIVLRLSKPDVSDPSKRRHFEISIDSPFHILSCQATQSNIFLPAYTQPNQPACQHTQQTQCGCPGSPVRRLSPPNYVPTLSSLSSSQPTTARSSSDLAGSQIQPPPAAHIAGDAAPTNSAAAHIPVHQRPMHMIRAPSYNPPAFDDEEPPPPLETPPPQYDSIASPTSGLADYFARLSDAYSTAETETESDAEDDDGVSTPTNRGSLLIEQPPASVVPLTQET